MGTFRTSTTSSRTLLVAKSVHHGNTSRVADAMRRVLRADRVAPEDCPYDSVSGYDLVGVGSGIYYGRVHPELWHWVSGLPEKESQHLRAFIFTTSGMPFLSPLWHMPLRRLFARKGIRVIGEFACGGLDTWGPLWLAGGLKRGHPDARDLAMAEAFAADMARRVWPLGTPPCSSS